MRNSPFWWVLIGFMVLLDIYVFQAVKLLASPAGPRTKSIVVYGYWIISILALVILLVLPYLKFDSQHKILQTTIFAVIAGIFFAKLIAAFFFLLDDIRRLFQWLFTRIFYNKKNTEGAVVQTDAISRSVFLTWVGTLAGTGLFGTLVYGFGNKYRYQVKKVKLSFDNLPDAFKGIKIVQVSDIHSGSLADKQAVMKGIQKIMEQKADLVLFTGDLVNNKAEEMEGFMDVFDKLQAPLGVYSTLGNHDYGDYVTWGNKDEKVQNLQRVINVHKELGWRLLMDEHIILERGGEQIALLGVQNISGRRGFHSYGNMSKAYSGSESIPFKILMSHDPSHWDAEVRKEFADIDLTLSGHTHGMQFGVELPGFKWSPIQYVYKQWAGLYETGKQKLYVNRGFGFIGYPGRVGILPEITVIELA